MNRAARLAKLDKLEGEGSRLIVAKLAAGVDLNAFLLASGITPTPRDTIVRIARPEGCGVDYAKVSA